MKHAPSGFHRTLAPALMALFTVLCGAACCHAQGNGSARTFPQPRAAIEKALKELQPAAAGRLPVLEGFATSASDHPLNRYQRGYYQSRFDISAAPDGGSIVRVSVQVTAWYTDPVAARSGYRLLSSNGRLEADLLDQLADQLGGNAPQSSPEESSSAEAEAEVMTAPAAAEPTISAPVPRLPESRRGFSSSRAQSLAEPEITSPQTTQKQLTDEHASALRAEAESLEEILKNQAHPKNLVAIKKSGTPVAATASLTAKTLFLASAHDEFEMLDFNRDWVHVRISGLSRGWIWRTSLEMPDGIPNADAPAGTAPVAADLFHVTREETAPFPGDWAPLRGKRVEIVSVEKITETKPAGPQLRLEFAKSVLDNDYGEIAQKAQELAGIVLIFDSVDGGMIAATFPMLQQWKAGKMSDAALWHQCFFDPPETFNESGISASQ